MDISSIQTHLFTETASVPEQVSNSNVEKVLSPKREVSWLELENESDKQDRQTLRNQYH